MTVEVEARPEQRREKNEDGLGAVQNLFCIHDSREELTPMA